MFMYVSTYIYKTSEKLMSKTTEQLKEDILTSQDNLPAFVIYGKCFHLFIHSFN